MTKSVSHISQRIICPKCGTRHLRKSMSANNTGKEFFCDHDHEYFDIAELVNKWNYDAGDFYGDNGQTQLTFREAGLIHFWLRNKPAEEKITATKWFDGNGTYSCDEPVWSSEIARDEGYDVVNRMLMGIEELEWDFDVNDLPYPIGAVGSC